MKDRLLFWLQLTLGLAGLAVVLYGFALGAGMDDTARPPHPHCEHAP